MFRSNPLASNSSVLVLQYKVVGYNQKVHDYSFQINTESLRKTHKLVIKMDDPDYDAQDTFHVDLEFNKKTDQSITEISSIDDIETITLTQRYKDGSSIWSESDTQKHWSDELQRLAKKLSDLEVILKYEQEEKTDPMCDQVCNQRIQKLNEKIRQHKNDIDLIKNETCEIDYQETITVKQVVLPRATLGRMSIDEFGRWTVFQDGCKIDFYWNVNELINLNIFNVEDVKNMTVTEKHSTDHKKVISKLSHTEKRKYCRLYE